VVSQARPSRTALRVALRRAAHQLLDSPRVLDDPIALAIVGPGAAAETATRIPTARCGCSRSITRRRRPGSASGSRRPRSRFRRRVRCAPIDFERQTLAERLSATVFQAIEDLGAAEINAR
jgi:O-methyltransferase involved in polyketide biosynthesis